MPSKLVYTGAIILLGLGGNTFPALAHMQSGAHGSNPCYNDAKEYCGGMVNTSSGVPTCLKSHIAQLSASCKARLQHTMAK
jgi:hypothetical protein